MIQVLTALLFLVAAFNTSLGLIILFGAQRNVQSFFFFLFTLSVALWCIGIAMFYIVDTGVDVLLFAKLYYIAAATIGFSLLAFAMAYLYRHVSFGKIALLLVPFSAAVGISVMPSGLILGVDASSSRAVELNQPVYTLYTLYILLYIYSAIALIGLHLLKAVRHHSSERFGLLYIFIALMVAGTFGVYFNLLLPYVGNYDLVWVGPLFSIVMVGFIFASILRHRLFDVRLVIARTVGYIMLLFAIALIYGSAVFVVSQLLFPSDVMSAEQYITNIALAVFTAFSYQPLKRFFDKVTDKIFFRDAYDPEVVLDELSEVVVNQIELKKLADESLELIRSALKSSFAALALSEAAANNKGHLYTQGKVTSKEFPGIAEVFSAKKEIVIRNGQSRETNEISFMKAHDIDIMLPLVASKKYLGCVVLGVKQNGGVYSEKDLNLATIAVNELAIACLNAQRFEEIKAFNKTLEARIEDATAELKVTNRKLQNLDKSKDEFISMASHQLRTPLTAVKGYISMMLEGDIGKITSEQRQVLEQAYDSSQRMVFLIGDFLNVSRLQTGKFVIEPSVINFTNLVAEEVDQLVDTARTRNITLNYEKPTTDLVSVGDENKLRQVMMNFMDNAIFYSPNGSSVDILLYKDASNIVFKVVDHGIGVPKSEQSKLFTKFFRAPNARQQRPDGTGIGIYMAKKVIVALEGVVIFESKEGEGSTFGFKLPLKNELHQLDKQPDTTASHAKHDRAKTH